MITLHNLSLKIANKLLFENLSLTFLPSAIVYIRGKNGAGKTSLLRIIANIQKATSGSVRFNKVQLPIEQLPLPYCTYIGHNLAVESGLTILENMEYWASLFGAEMLIPAALKYFALEDMIDSKCQELSEGMRKKVALTRLIICPSKLWLLDEIDTNLDDENQELLTRLITTHANNGGYVFIASHGQLPIKTAIQLNLDQYKT